MISPSKRQQAQRELLYQRAGQEIRTMRLAAGASQEMVADLFGWTRDALSKIERGIRPISLFEYLNVMWFLRSSKPDHPAVALAGLLLYPKPAERPAGKS